MHPQPLVLVFAFVATVGSTVAQDGQWVDRLVAPSVAASCSGELFVFDAARRESVWFGRACRQTWVWNGASWSQRSTPTAPPADLGAAVFDTSRNVVVAVFGGLGGAMETWEWDGLAWSLRSGAPTPLRRSFGLAFDAARNVTVLFGGITSTEDGHADTWTWNGTSWQQVWLGGPSPRWDFGMTYDAQHQRVVLFGGRGPVNGTTSYLGDTWEWNGVYWLNHFGLSGPSPRQGCRLAFDSRRQRTLLQGGYDNSTLQQTWEWNGSAWTQWTPAGTPAANPTDLVYDHERSVFVMMANSTTWEYVPGSLVPATFASYGTGCTGPTGVPQLVTANGSLPRIGSTFQLRLTNLPPSFLNVPLGFLGFDAASWNGLPLPLSLAALGFPGCDALLAPIRTDGLMNINGVADWNVVLPMTAFALGVDVYFQGAVLVPGWSVGGLVFSNGGHAVVGNP